LAYFILFILYTSLHFTVQ